MENQAPTPKAQAILNLYKLGGAVAMLLTVLMGIVVFTEIPDDTRYFPDSPEIFITLMLMAVNIAFASSAFFIFKRGESKVETSNGRVSSMYLLPAISIVTSAIYIMVKAMPEKVDPLVLALLISSLGSVVHLISLAKPMSKTVRLVSGYLQILFFILVIGRIYLDHSVEMNAPIKIFTQLTAMAGILNTLSDLRLTIGKEATALFAFSKLSLTILSIFSGVGSIIEAMPHVEKYGADYVIFPIIFLAMAIPAILSLFTTKLTAISETGEAAEGQEKSAE